MEVAMAEWEPAGTLQIDRCARCLGAHAGLVVRPLTNPTDEWTEWTTCPTTGEPILILLCQDATVIEAPRATACPGG